LLESRINFFVPRTLVILRWVLFFAVLAFVVHVVGLIDIRDWLISSVGVKATAVILSVAFILVAAFLGWLALTSWVDYRLASMNGRRVTARETTLLTLLRNAGSIAILVVAVMFALSEMGINIAPLLASAGVLGLAIGFGAQKLVQDIISGIFIQLENAINVGDVVTAAGTTGSVERLTIRSVSLRDFSGVYHIIPFSSVDMVSNFMRGFSYFVCDMGVAYKENVDSVRDAMIEAFRLLRESEHSGAIIGDLEWYGIDSFGDSAVVVRARIKTLPGMQWAVGRAYNGFIKQVFDVRNIEIPFPQRTVYFANNSQDGSVREPAAPEQMKQAAS